MQEKKNGKLYDPLSQISDSENGGDDLNQPSKSKDKQKYDCDIRRYLAYMILFVVLVVIIATCFALVHYKEKRDQHDKLNIVQTSIGSIKGVQELFHGTIIHKFMGVPYAEPPIGDQRWKNPVPKKKLSKVIFATRNNKICLQLGGAPYPKSKKETEDCLYLNIVTPTLNTTANLPVFVWIHGGYLINGYGDMIGYYPDSEFVADMNVVGVSIQYRLNAFGYLTLEEFWEKDKSHGNFGFMDQILALKWIKKNIQQFGGNPNLITVAGQSSGGTSIYGLVASPLARGLFQKGIPMSGSPNFPRNYSVAANDNRVFIKKSKCHTLSSKQEIKNCLYELSPKEVIGIIPTRTLWNFDDLLDFPTFNRIDGSIIVIDPVTIPVAPQNAYLIKNSTSKVDLLIGSTAQEPSINPIHHFKNDSSLKAYIDKKLKDYGTITSNDVYQVYENVSTYVKGKIDTQYLYETMVTDVRSTCPTNKLVKDFRKSSHLSDTYRYISAWKPKPPLKLPPLITIVNAAHALDSFALFGFQMFPNITITPSERQFMTTIRQVFKKFMVEGKVDGAKPGETIVFNGDGNVENIVGDYHKEQCEMWSEPENGFLPYVWIN